MFYTRAGQDHFDMKIRHRLSFWITVRKAIVGMLLTTAWKRIILV